MTGSGAAPSREHTGVDLEGDPDLALAARSDAAVLLSGDPEAAASLAYRLHLSSVWRHGAFTVIDCTAPDMREDAIMELVFPVAAQGVGVVQLRLVQAGTVLLREVHAMPLPVQRQVAERLCEFSRGPTCGRARRRLMASSSKPLIDLVHAGAFDDELYYRLNMFHVHV